MPLPKKDPKRFTRDQVVQAEGQVAIAVEIDPAKASINVYARATHDSYTFTGNRLARVAVGAVMLRFRAFATENDVHLYDVTCGFGYTQSKTLGELGRYSVEEVVRLELANGDSYEAELKKVADVAIEHFGPKRARVDWNHGMHGRLVSP